MDFFNNDLLVKEVLDFANSGALLRDVCPSVYSDCKIELDFVEAKRYAWSQDPSVGDVSWVNLRGVNARAFSKEKYNSPDWRQLNIALGELLGELTATISHRLPRMYREILDDVVGDLHNCAAQRAILGHRPGLIERIFVGYRNGGWSCGWSGSYPSGQMIVYVS